MQDNQKKRKKLHDRTTNLMRLIYFYFLIFKLPKNKRYIISKILSYIIINLNYIHSNFFKSLFAKMNI